MKKRFITAAVFVLILGAAGVLWSGWSRGDVSHSIRISGNIELTEVNIAFKNAGKLLELAVDEGAPVHRGMLLARIDREQTEHQKDKEQASLAAAESDFVQLNTAIEYSREST